ncbi:MAG: hypothetical protein KDE14_01740, partial [Rhodobacteraceae bacterium]|nr:hypothetical protein [Paracoccaceae bacterium]
MAIAKAIPELIAEAAQFEIGEVIELRWRELTTDFISTIDPDRDVFVLGAGGYFMFKTAQDLNPDVIADLQILNSVPCPMILFGPGTNLFVGDKADASVEPNAASRAALNRLAHKVRGGFVRDRVSE